MNPTQPGKLLWLVILAGFWALFGLTGRGAWQADEALHLADVLGVLHDGTSLWATSAPLFSLVASLLAWLSPFGLDLQNSARLATGVFILFALLATGLAARHLLGKGFGAAAVLALMGGLGLMLRAHAFMPESALVAVWAMLFWGIGLARTSPKYGGLLIGLSLAALALGMRGLPDLLAGIVILLLPWSFVSWRERSYRKALALSLPLAGGLILAGLGLIASQGLFDTWLTSHGPGRFLPLMTPGKLFSELAWFAWPLWPLALAAIWHDHRRLARTPAILPPLIGTVVLLVAALVPAWSRLGSLLPLLVPLSLLAALSLEHLRRGAAQALYWFGVMCFLFFIAAFWVYFSAIEWGIPTELARHVARLTPNYTPGSVSPTAIFIAAVASLLWVIAIPLFPRAKTRPVLVWATGMVLTWTLLATLFRPWAEAGWGYRPMLDSLAQKLPQGTCLTAQVDPAMETMLRYHLGTGYRPGETTACGYHLEVVDRRAKTSSPDTVWEGSRPRYKDQIYRLVRAHEG